MPFDPSTAMPSDVSDLVDAITHVESGGDSNAVSAQGARGSMQIMPGTFQHYAQPGESYDNDDDRRAAAIRKINDDYAHYGGDVAKTAAAYLGGRGAVLADGSIRSDVSDANGTTPASYANMVLARIAKNNTFDPSTARLVVDASGPATSSFDPATASPTDFDPSTARLMSGAASPTSFDPSTARLMPGAVSPTTTGPSTAKPAPGTRSPTTNAPSAAKPAPSHLQPGELEALEASLAAALNNLPPAQGSQLGPANLAAYVAQGNANNAKLAALSQTHPAAPNSGAPSFMDEMKKPGARAQPFIVKDEPTTWDRVKDYGQDVVPSIGKGLNGFGKSVWGLLSLMARSGNVPKYGPAWDTTDVDRQLAENYLAAGEGRAPQQLAPAPKPSLDEASKVVSAGASQLVTAVANAVTGNHIAPSTIAEAPSISQGFAVTDGDMNAMSSDSLLQAQKKVQADTDAQKGFWNKSWSTVKGTVSNPQLLASSVEEMIPSLLLTRSIATKVMPAIESAALKEADLAYSAALNEARDKAIVAGADKAAAEVGAKQIATDAAKNAEANYISANAPNAAASAATKAMTAQGAGTAYVDASNTVMNLPQDVLAKNPNYQRLIAQGMSPADARSQLAQQAGVAAAAISVPINAAGGRFGIGKDIGAVVAGTSKTTAKSVAVNVGTDAAIGYATGAAGQMGNNAVQKEYGDSSTNLGDNVAAAGVHDAINTTAGAALLHGWGAIAGKSSPHGEPLQRSDDNANQANQANEKDAPSQNQQPQQNPHSTPTGDSTNPDTPAVAAILSAPDIATTIHAAEQAASTPADQLVANRLVHQVAPATPDAAAGLTPEDAARLQTPTRLRDQTPDANTQALLQQHIEALVRASPKQIDADPGPTHQGKLNDDQTSIGNALAGTPGVGTDINGAPTLNDIPVVVRHPETLPDHSVAEPGQLSRQQAEAYGNFLDAAGKKLTIYRDHPDLPDGFADPNNPDHVFLSDQTTHGSDVIVQHEFTHALEQSSPALYKTALEVMKSGLRPGAMEEARAGRHGNLSDDEIHREMLSDIAGNAGRQDGFWHQVIGKVRDKYGDTRAASIIKKFTDAISASVDKIKSLRTGGQFEVKGSDENIGDKYVSNLADVHSALSDAYAEHFGKQLDNTPITRQEIAEQKRQANLATLDGMSKKELADTAQTHPATYMRKAAADALAQRKAEEAPARSTAASKVAKLRTARDKTIDTEKDTMADAIVKLGGIDSRAVRYSPEELDVRGRIGNLSGRVFHRNGLPPDIMSEHLAEHGYVDRDQSGKADKADFQDKLDRVAAGEDVHTPQAIMRKAAEDHANAMQAVGAHDSVEYDAIERHADAAPAHILPHVEANFDKTNPHEEISDDDINRQLGQASSRFSEKHSDQTSLESDSGNQAPNASGPGEFSPRGQTHEADQAALDQAHRRVLLARTDAERIEAARKLVEVNKEIAARQESGSDDVESGQSADDSVTEKKSRFSAKDNQDVLREIAKHDELFKLPKSKSDSVEGIALDNDPDIKVNRPMRVQQGVEAYQLSLPDGTKAYISVRQHDPYADHSYGSEIHHGSLREVTNRPGRNAHRAEGRDDVYVDTSRLDEGSGYGAKVYNIAATFAHNTGRIFIGDPQGISDKAMQRRPEQMLSSALKFGTTDHIAPHPRQVKGDKNIGVKPLDWVYGDHIGNIKKLVDVNQFNIESHGGNGDITYNKKTGQFEDAHGNPITRGDIESLAKSTDLGREAGAGGTTLARHALFKSLIQGEGGQLHGPDGVLVSLGKQLREHDTTSDSAPLKHIAYSRKTDIEPEPDRLEQADDARSKPDDEHKETTVNSSSGKEIDPADKDGKLTRAGRALQKHGSRPGSAFPKPKGGPAEMNARGQSVLEQITDSPNSTKTFGNRFGGADVIHESGIGARFDAAGTLRGFLEPPIK